MQTLTTLTSILNKPLPATSLPVRGNTSTWLPAIADYCLAGVVAICCALVLCTPARADDSSDSAFRISGYGTLGDTWDSRSNIAPIRDISQSPQNSAITPNSFSTTPTNWRLDTRVGLQADYRLNPNVEFVTQLVLRDHVSANLADSFQAAYIGLRPQTNVDVRVGRVGYDAFLMSDTRDLGYSYSWVRPPIEFYGWIPIFSVDGIDAAYKFGSENQWRIKAQYGQSAFSLPMGTALYDFSTSNLLALTLTRQSGPWRIKGGYSQFTIASESGVLDPLRAGLNAVANATATIDPAVSQEADNLITNVSFQNAKVEYMTLGASYDDGTWLGQAELGKSRSTSEIVPHGDMGYIGIGRRFGDWTPYAMLSAIRPEKGVRAPESNWNAIGQGGFQNQTLSLLNSTRMDQETASIGLRWDFSNQAALKLQWNSTRIQQQGYGLWFRDPSLNNHSSSVNLLSLNLDYVF